MSLHDAVNYKVNQVKGPRSCKLANIMASMEPREREAAGRAIKLVQDEKATAGAEPHFTIAWLTEILNDNGFPIGKTTVSDHVNGVCACDR